jgi:hypothetical protein
MSNMVVILSLHLATTRRISGDGAERDGQGRNGRLDGRNPTLE